MARHRCFFCFLLATLAGLSSCSDRPTPPVQPPATTSVYFDLSGFIQQQARQLNTTRPTIEKTVTTRPGAAETTRQRPPDWDRELETFTQADLNKPALRAAYQITTTTTADGRTKTTYRQRPGYRDTPVEYLEIITAPDQRVSQISGRQTSRNALVQAGKTFSLTCAPVNGQNRLIYYRVNGTQKTVFFAALRYDVQVRVR